MAWEAVMTLIHGERLYTELLADISRDDRLVAAMWADAESRPDELDIPETHWTVTLLEDGTPAAWCAARFQDDGVLKCHSNYEVRAYRGRGLYEAAFHARHNNVVLAYKRPAVTYLFSDPIALHETRGWRCIGATGHGELDGHQWWELRR
jgi:hypothetical protein